MTECSKRKPTDRTPSLCLNNTPISLKRGFLDTPNRLILKGNDMVATHDKMELRIGNTDIVKKIDFARYARLTL